MSNSWRKTPIIAIIGRTNVGKSSLFNRLLHRRKAVVHELPGITRDRNYASMTWNRREFLLVDTGGILSKPESDIEASVTQQATTAIEEADEILFVVEKNLLTEDYRIAEILRKVDKPIIVVVNKVDKRMDNWSGAEAEGFGVGNVFRVSAKLGYGTGDLLDEIIEKLPPCRSTKTKPSDEISVAIVGRPNVGKSSIANKLVGREIVITNPEPGTTIDAVDEKFKFKGIAYRLVDTAGLFRRKNDITYFAGLRTLNAIEECDVAILVMDGTEGLTRQDKKISATIIERYKGLVIAMNKWDLLPLHTAEFQREFERKIRIETPFLNFISIVFTSAKTGHNIFKLMKATQEVVERCKMRIQTSKLNELIHHLQNEHPPPRYRGRKPKIMYAVQTNIQPPEFILFSKLPYAIAPSYQRYITNQIRERFDYQGVTFKLRFKQRR